jgi:chromosome segregation ATPase
MATPDNTLAIRVGTSLASVITEAKAIKERIASLTITDESSHLIAVETSSIITRLKKMVEKARKDQVDPLNAEVKEVNTHFKQYSDRLDELDKSVRGKLSTWDVEQERIRQEKEERQRKALEELRRKELEEAAKNKTEAPAALVIPTKEVEKTTRSDTGSATSMLFWNFEVTDIDALYKARPELVKMEAKRREALIAVEADQTIPGLRIFRDSKQAVR